MVRSKLLVTLWSLWLCACFDTGTTQVGAGSGSGGGSSSSGGEMETPLPCELSDMLLDLCGQCHGIEPKGGALRSLRSHEDLTASGDGHDTLAEACITRMELPADDDERMPLAPRSPSTAADIDLVRAFVNAGFPARPEGETCE